MIGEREKLGDFIELVLLDHRDRNFQPVDRALLHGGECFGPGHRHRAAAHRGEHVDVHRVLHDAVLHALDVFGLLHRAHVVDHVAKAAFHVAQHHQALGFELLGHLAAGGTVEDALRLRFVGVQEWQVVDLIRRFDLRDHRVGDDARIGRAEAHAFHQLLLIAQGAVGEQLHLDAAARAALHRGLEGARTDGVRILRGVAAGPAEFEHDLVLGRRGQRQGDEQRCGHGQRTNQLAARGHGVSSGCRTSANGRLWVRLTNARTIRARSAR